MFSLSIILISNFVRLIKCTSWWNKLLAKFVKVSSADESSDFD